MKALVIVAHGSRREASNNEIRELARRLKQRVGESFDDVRCAFLELAEPLIPDGIEQSILAGASQVTVMPYFLSAGRHVAQDIPAEVAKAQEKYPEIHIHIAPYLGLAESLLGVILEQAGQT